MSQENNLSIYEAVLRTSSIYPTSPALYYKGKTISYSLLIKRVNSLASNLLKNGVSVGDSVSVCLPNFPFAIYLLYAINQIGASVNLIHPLASKTQIKEYMTEVSSKILFCLDLRYLELKDIENIQIIPCNPADELAGYKRLIYKKRNKDKLSFSNNVIQSKDFIDKTYSKKYVHDYECDAIYLHSGGTSGKSKTIALSSFSLNSLASTTKYILNKEDMSNTYMYSVLPMFHGFGLCMGIHALLYNGGASTITPKFNSKEAVKLTKKNKVNYLIGVPTLYSALLKNPKFKGRILKKLYAAFIGGDNVSKTLIVEFNDLMKKENSYCRMFEGYGLTETVTVISVNTHEHNKVGSVGMALPNTKIAIIDSKSLSFLEPNTEGEIVCSGDTLMNGYLCSQDNPFFTDEFNTKWVRTGDYGKIDNEGYLFFIQRLKRIIKVSGINIFPTEIETLVQKLSYIDKAVAVSIPDEAKGQMVKLYIKLKNINDINQENIKKQIKNLIKEEYSVYATPKEIIILDEFPKTPVGKIDVKRL